MSENQRDIEIFENQPCPMCGKNKATFTEYEIEDPYAEVIYILSLKCNHCGYKKADLEMGKSAGPAEYTVKIEKPEDLNIRVIKSGECEIKIPRLGLSMDSTLNGEYFVSNIEGVLTRFKKQLQFLKEGEDDKKIRTKIKNIIKKIDKVIAGEDEMTITLSDKTGNSAIISDKVKVKKLK